MSITQILALSIEELQTLTLAELSELHNTVKESKQKKAGTRADLIAGIITAKKKEIKKEASAPLEEKQAELVGAENSIKKPKVKTVQVKSNKGTVKPKPQEILDALLKKQAEQDKKDAELPADLPFPPAPDNEKLLASIEAEKKPEAPKKIKSLKRPKEDKPKLEELTPEQLLAYVKSLEAKTEKFQSSIVGEKSTYNRTEFDTITDIQRELLKNPMKTYMFIDENLNDKKMTQFLVIFASPECIVLLDRNNQKNTTFTFNPDDLTATQLVNGKNKYDYAFYTRVVHPKK